MRHNDTISKIVGTYLAGVCSEAFVYNGKRYEPKTIVVSPLLLRGFTCPTGCGACCGSFSLDYLPSELATSQCESRKIKLDNIVREIFSDRQNDLSDRWCRHLDQYSGRCSIYSSRPMACDFELIRFLFYVDKVVLTQKLYGRAWAMTRIDGKKGTLCEMLPVSPTKIAEVLRKLERLEDWAIHFEIPTRINEICKWIRGHNHFKSLIIKQ